MEGPLVDYAAKGTKVRLRRGTVDGHDCLQSCEARPRAAKRSNIGIDSYSFLDVKGTRDAAAILTGAA